MKHYYPTLKIFVIALITTSLFGFVLANFVPLNVLDYFLITSKRLGATSITTIAGTDTLSSSRTTINNNFSSLNLNKVEISDLAATTTLANLSTLTGLVTTGTITTGTWNGTAIGAAYGGTGSTTLSSNQVLLGNGTGNMGVVAGLGTNGQFLTSGGVGTPPTWTTSAIALGDNYTWTGHHIFTTLFGTNATTTNLTVSGTFNWGSLYLTAPSTNNATSTVLANNGSGGLSFVLPDWYLVTSTTTEAAMSVATTTISGAPEYLKILVYNPNALSGATSYRINFNGDRGANYGYQFTGSGGSQTDTSSSGNIDMLISTATTSPAMIELMVKNDATTVKSVIYSSTLWAGGSQAPGITSGGGVWNNVSDNISSFQLTFGVETMPAGATIKVYGSGR